MSRPILRACLSALLLALCTTARAQVVDGQQFRDWTARCETLPDGSKAPCYLVQIVLLKEDNQPLLHMAVRNQSAGEEPAAFISLPLGVSLPGGLSLMIDESQPLRLRYERCDRNGCHAPLPLDADLVNRLKGGRWARVSFFDTTRREVSVPVSLLGFTAAFDSLRN